MRYKTLENVVIIDLCHKNWWMNVTGRSRGRRKKPPDEKNHLFLQLLPFPIVILVVKKNLFKWIRFSCKGEAASNSNRFPSSSKEASS